MDKPLCICTIDAFGMRDVPTCPSCHPAPPAAAPEAPDFNLLPLGEQMKSWSPGDRPGGPGMDDWTPIPDFIDLEDDGDTEIKIQEILDEQADAEECGGCGGGCSICSPDS